MKATEWWQRAKQACAKHTSPFVEIDKSRLGTLLALFLTRVVVATYVDKDDQTWQDFFAWLADIQGNAIYPAEVLPYVAAKRTESVAEIVNQLITDLNSDDELAIASAANAVRHYVVLYRAGSVLLPYSDLVSALVERVAYRRRVALSVCILRLTQLLAQNPFAINATQLSNLSQSLVAWLEQLPLELGAAGEFTEYERPAYRRHLAILAGVLWALYESAGNEIPSSINSWKESSESDPLPEVRRAFDEGMTIFTDAQIKERS
jgi:hypothetical protein